MFSPTAISVLSYDSIGSRAPDGFYRLLDLSCDLEMVFFKSGQIEFMVELSRKRTVGFVPRFWCGTGMISLSKEYDRYHNKYKPDTNKYFFCEVLKPITREQFHDKVISSGHKTAAWFLFNLDMAEEKKMVEKK